MRPISWSGLLFITCLLTPFVDPRSARVEVRADAEFDAQSNSGADSKADEGHAKAGGQPGASENYYKDPEFLPGEEVVTPTGKKMKVWSTKGPVPVSRAPDPFEDREKSTLNNANIAIDARDYRHGANGHGDNRHAGSNNDTFDHSPQPVPLPTPSALPSDSPSTLPEPPRDVPVEAPGSGMDNLE